jgi:hypothetical protein
MKINNNLEALNKPQHDFYIAKILVYDKCNFSITELNFENESKEYSACTCKLNGVVIKFRSSKITPKKIGQFVTIWKRNEKGVTEPFNIADDFDFIIISSRKDNNSGQFIFPKAVLYNKGIVAGNNKSGKRGIRVYPPWDKAANKLAEKTQSWQIKYFLPIKNDNLFDIDLAKKLITNTIKNDF